MKDEAEVDAVHRWLRSDPVPDTVWDVAARHYDELALTALVIQIALINAFNRLNATTRQVAGAWVG